MHINDIFEKCKSGHLNAEDLHDLKQYLPNVPATITIPVNVITKLAERMTCHPEQNIFVITNECGNYWVAVIEHPRISFWFNPDQY